ncbi:MAG TPA: hypothetical protein VF836_12040 [Gemmatimonadaceae bacterium]
MKSVSLVLALCGVLACSSVNGPEIRQVTGTVRFNTVAGGFFYNQGDDGVSYSPSSSNQLLACCKSDGLRIQVTLKILGDADTYIPGKIVEIESISSPTLICSA